MYRLLTDNDRPINLFFLAFWRTTTYPLTSLSRLQTATINPFTYFFRVLADNDRPIAHLPRLLMDNDISIDILFFLPIWIQQSVNFGELYFTILPRLLVGELTFAQVDEEVFQQSIGIAMDINCASDNTLHIQKAKTARTLANNGNEWKQMNQ